MAELFVSHLNWTGAAGGPARDTTSFSRDLQVDVGPTSLPMSSAPGFRGDPRRVNPEQLFVAALSSCQALTYLFLAAKHRIGVVEYTDDAEGRLDMVDGRMRMSDVTLRPRIVVEYTADEARARELVEQAHRQCFIGNSVVTAVRIEPAVVCAPVAVMAR
jgi:organic hydroperoxide reductase OsmC/OhrA